MLNLFKPILIFLGILVFCSIVVSVELVTWFVVLTGIIGLWLGIQLIQWIIDKEIRKRSTRIILIISVVILDILFVCSPIFINYWIEDYQEKDTIRFYIVHTSKETFIELARNHVAPWYCDENTIRSNGGRIPRLPSKKLFGDYYIGMKWDRAYECKSMTDSKLEGLKIGYIKFTRSFPLADEDGKVCGVSLYFDSKDAPEDSMPINSLIEYLNSKFGDSYFESTSGVLYMCWMSDAGPVVLECQKYHSNKVSPTVYFLDLPYMAYAYDRYCPDTMRPGYEERKAIADSIAKAKSDSIEADRREKEKIKQAKQEKKASSVFESMF